MFSDLRNPFVRTISLLAEGRRPKNEIAQIESTPEYREYNSLSDGEVILDLATYDKSIWEKVKDFIVGLIEKIKKAYAELSPNSKLAKVLKDAVDNMSELQRMWAEGVKEAGERPRSWLALRRRAPRSWRSLRSATVILSDAWWPSRGVWPRRSSSNSPS